jgi:outer membrane cobalamin receptor
MRALLLFIPCAFVALAQSTGTVEGSVHDPTGAAVPQARITITNPLSNFVKQTESDATGLFRIPNLPLQTYQLTVERAGFQLQRTSVRVTSNVSVRVEVILRLAGNETEVVVSADAFMLVNPEATGTRAQMNEADLQRLAGNRGLESALATFPGFAQNANGAIHPRGAHNQMTFVIDGMPVTDQLTGAFSNAVDPNVVQTVELFTGSIPAEFGSKVSAVVNVTTRSGLGSGRRFTGSQLFGAAQFDQLQSVTQITGESGTIGYSGTFTAMKSNRYLDQVSLDNLHNGGNNQRALFRVDLQPNQKDTWRFNAMYGNAPFQLANLRSQHANLMNQRQLLRDWAGSIGYLRTLTPRTTFESTTSYRMAGSQLFGSPGDTPVTASQARRTSTITTGARINHIWNNHTLRAGFDVQTFPVREHFQFAVTDPAFNVPGSEEFVETLLRHDLSRGGTFFTFSKKRIGRMASFFAQDNWKLGRLQLSLGLRYDNYRFLVRGQQWQPRVGVAFNLKETGTVLRASYNRNYQTPPNENLLLSNSEESTSIVAPNIRQTLGGALALIRPERQNFYELGIQQAAGRFSLDVSYYHKDSRDQNDNNNFFDTGIIFPITLAAIRVNGVEGRVVLPQYRGLSATVSITHSRAVSTPPFTGGLFIGQEAVESLSAGPFIIDHDQALSLNCLLSYTSRRGFFASLNSRHDSGLVTNPSDPAEVAADPDFFDLLPFVNLNANVPRTRPRTIHDLVLGYTRTVNDQRKWEASLQVSNLTGTTALCNFQSVFVGTRVVAPRVFGGRVRFFF